MVPGASIRAFCRLFGTNLPLALLINYLRISDRSPFLRSCTSQRWAALLPTAKSRGSDFVTSSVSPTPSQFRPSETKQVLVSGIEAHICVNQTVHDLLALGLQVHLLTDCITSRKENDRTAALQKMLSSGAISSSVEMALFELMRDAKHEQFKAIQGLIK